MNHATDAARSLPPNPHRFYDARSGKEIPPPINIHNLDTFHKLQNPTSDSASFAAMAIYHPAKDNTQKSKETDALNEAVQLLNRMPNVSTKDEAENQLKELYELLCTKFFYQTCSYSYGTKVHDATRCPAESSNYVLGTILEAPHQSPQEEEKEKARKKLRLLYKTAQIHTDIRDHNKYHMINSLCHIHQEPVTTPYGEVKNFSRQSLNANEKKCFAEVLTLLNHMAPCSSISLEALEAFYQTSLPNILTSNGIVCQHKHTSNSDQNVVRSEDVTCPLSSWNRIVDAIRYPDGQRINQEERAEDRVMAKRVLQTIYGARYASSNVQAIMKQKLCAIHTQNAEDPASNRSSAADQEDPTQDTQLPDGNYTFIGPIQIGYQSPSGSSTKGGQNKSAARGKNANPSPGRTQNTSANPAGYQSVFRSSTNRGQNKPAARGKNANPSPGRIPKTPTNQANSSLKPALNDTSKARNGSVDHTPELTDAFSIDNASDRTAHKESAKPTQAVASPHSNLTHNMEYGPFPPKTPQQQSGILSSPDSEGHRLITNRQVLAPAPSPDSGLTNNNNSSTTPPSPEASSKTADVKGASSSSPTDSAKHPQASNKPKTPPSRPSSPELKFPSATKTKVTFSLDNDHALQPHPLNPPPPKRWIHRLKIPSLPKPSLPPIQIPRDILSSAAQKPWLPSVLGWGASSAVLALGVGHITACKLSAAALSGFGMALGANLGGLAMMGLVAAYQNPQEAAGLGSALRRLVLVGLPAALGMTCMLGLAFPFYLAPWAGASVGVALAEKATAAGLGIAYASKAFLSFFAPPQTQAVVAPAAPNFLPAPLLSTPLLRGLSLLGVAIYLEEIFTMGYVSMSAVMQMETLVSAGLTSCGIASGLALLLYASKTCRLSTRPPATRVALHGGLTLGLGIPAAVGTACLLGVVLPPAVALLTGVSLIPWASTLGINLSVAASLWGLGPYAAYHLTMEKAPCTLWAAYLLGVIYLCPVLSMQWLP